LWLFFKRKQLLEIKIALVLKWLPEGGLAMARPSGKAWHFEQRTWGFGTEKFGDITDMY